MAASEPASYYKLECGNWLALQALAPQVGKAGTAAYTRLYCRVSITKTTFPLSSMYQVEKAKT